MTKPELLPPTVLQQELAEQINKQLDDFGFKVTFYRAREEDGEIRHGMIWECICQGKQKRKPHPLSADEYFDAAGIVRAMRAWRANFDTVSERYTTVMPEDWLNGPEA